MQHNKNTIWLIIIGSALLHGLIIYLSIPFTNYDLNSWRIGGESVLKGINIYPIVALRNLPFLPLFLYLEAFALIISSKIFTQIIILKIIFSFFNLCVIYLIYLLSKKNAYMTALYAFNPVSLLVTCFHGQFDSLPVFLILLCVYLIQKRRKTIPLLILSFAITLKTWPVLFCIPLFRLMKTKFTIRYIISSLTLLSIFPILCTAFYTFFFHANPLLIAKVVISYGGVVTIWGLSKGLFLLIGKNKILFFVLKLLFVVILFVFQIRNKEKSVFTQIYFAMVLFFVITTGFGIQYFYWIIPFAFLSEKSNGKVYMAILSTIVMTYLTFMNIPVHPILVEFIPIATWLVLAIHFFASLPTLILCREN
jgi:hypothetical protein